MEYIEIPENAIITSILEILKIPNKNGVYFDEEYQELYHYVNNQLHREDGPAFESNYQLIKNWYKYGKLHRLDGPAIIGEYHQEVMINGQYSIKIIDERVWFVDGKRVPCSSQKEFEKMIKLKAFW